MKLAIYIISALFAMLNVSAVEIKGANGRSVDFAGILKASEAGLTVKVTSDSTPMLVAWEKIDLDDLKTSQPDIYRAYTQSSLGQKEVILKLGIYENYQTYDETIASLRKDLETEFHVPVPSSYDHWINNHRSRWDYDDYIREKAKYHQMINDLFGGMVVRTSNGMQVSSVYYSYYYSNYNWRYYSKTTAKRVLEYFGSSRDTFHDTLAYVQDNPILVLGVAEKLQSAKATLIQNGLAGVHTDHGTIEFVLDSSINALEGLAEGRAYNQKVTRVLGKMVHVAYKEQPKGE
ncbi:hypothetical protein [Cerasicoccus arenae]|uniref:Uncharacterized protein n=1 Tax=Cerasicoccus arenae TaxID=424488 RepID=A0A8J3DFU3_9BACT|nr:hypothetical protein [Cerasicoccus arenae]MBK1859498.1 hypothetical protein [Cerasicoccus arenae]GHB94991.1 hypothetical protein GCM10007047_08200 [Cerasicoccus arenae]